MPLRFFAQAHVWPAILEVLKALGAFVGGLFTVQAWGPFGALFVCFLGEAASAYLLLPARPTAPDGRALADVDPLIAAGYRAERAQFWRKRQRRIVLIVICLAVSVAFTNAHGFAGFDRTVALAVSSALIWLTFTNAQRSDELFTSVRETVEGFLPRRRNRALEADRDANPTDGPEVPA